MGCRFRRVVCVVVVFFRVRAVFRFGIDGSNLTKHWINPQHLTSHQINPQNRRFEDGSDEEIEASVANVATLRSRE